MLRTFSKNQYSVIVYKCTSVEKLMIRENANSYRLTVHIISLHFELLNLLLLCTSSKTVPSIKNVRSRDMSKDLTSLRLGTVLEDVHKSIKFNSSKCRLIMWTVNQYDLAFSCIITFFHTCTFINNYTEFVFSFVNDFYRMFEAFYWTVITNKTLNIFWSIQSLNLLLWVYSTIRHNKRTNIVVCQNIFRIKLFYKKNFSLPTLFFWPRY